MKVLSAIASIWTALIATLALHTWKRTTNAQKQIEFLDNLIETMHEYIQGMATPIQLWEFSKLGINAHSEIHEKHPLHFPLEGIVSYINKNGERAQAKLNMHLDKIRPIRSRLDALAAKGQIFGFDNYASCLNACNMLSWSHGQLEACAMLLGSSSLNWENELVQQTMSKIISVDAEDIRKNMQTQNCILLEFAREAYTDLVVITYPLLPIIYAWLPRSKAWIDKLKQLFSEISR
jgi:hypothetical protein